MSDEPREQKIVLALDGYEPEIGRLLWMLDDTRQRTLAVLEGITNDALNWTPAHGGNSMATLLYHLAAIEADWLYAEVLEQTDFPPRIVALFPADVRDEHGYLTPAQSTELDLDLFLDRLAAVRRLLLAAFAGMTRADFRRARELPDYAVTPEWVLHHLMQHEAEHRGQIGMLRELAESAERKEIKA